VIQFQNVQVVECCIAFSVLKVQNVVFKTSVFKREQNVVQKRCFKVKILLNLEESEHPNLNLVLNLSSTKFSTKSKSSTTFSTAVYTIYRYPKKIAESGACGYLYELVVVTWVAIGLRPRVPHLSFQFLPTNSSARTESTNITNRFQPGTGAHGFLLQPENLDQ
jgi:hypothetical protein